MIISDSSVMGEKPDGPGVARRSNADGGAKVQGTRQKKTSKGNFRQNRSTALVA